MLERFRPDAVLLDLMMPRLDGFGVIEKMRAEERYRDIPVVVFTAKTLTIEEMQALSTGAQQIVSKQGLDTEVLLRNLQNAMGQQK